MFLLITLDLQAQENWKGNKPKRFYLQASQTKIQSLPNTELAVKLQMALKCIADKTTLTSIPQSTTDTLPIPKIRLQTTEKLFLSIKITSQKLTFRMSLFHKQPGTPPNIINQGQA